MENLHLIYLHHCPHNEDNKNIIGSTLKRFIAKKVKVNNIQATHPLVGPFKKEISIIRISGIASLDTRYISTILTPLH